MASTLLIDGLNSPFLITGGLQGAGAPSSPTTATLSGSSTGKIGVASTNFTITLDQPATSPLSFPITYAGGSVTSSPVVFGIGDSSKTFTVTPSVSGANIVILGVGSTGLTIAGSPVVYTATASTATLSGPGTGPVNSASTSFTITLDAVAPSGGVSCPVTSSNGSDTVTTSPVVISAGNTSGTFTVTAINAGLRNITLATTTPSLTIAGSPISYLATAGPQPPSGGSHTTTLGMGIY